MEFFLSYSSGLSCSPEPFTFVSLLSLSLSLEATCLFYHFYAFLSTPFFAFCFFYTLFPFSYLFLSILLRSFVILIQKVTAERRSVVTLDCLLYLDKSKLTEQKLCESLEAPPRFELGNKGFADLCLTTWLWRRIQITKDAYFCVFCLVVNGAEDEIRTRDVHLGKVTLYH